MNRLIFHAGISFLMAILTTSCTGMWNQWTGQSNTRQGVSSSLVDYLYPKGEVPPEYDQTIPNLNLPLRVGLAFVPATATKVEGLSEAHKNQLLERVKRAFQNREFISKIEIIPDTYMRSSRGFEGIDQLSRLYGLDVIALVSYDQVAHADDTRSSLLYWTVVGAYVVKGSKNEVQTFVDTAIFDVKTHKLLLRAPGVNTLEETSTLIRNAEEMRKARAESFNHAMANMIVNLDQELDSFKERIRKDKSVSISHRQGYSGGGASLDLSMVLLLFALCFFKIHSDKKRRCRHS